MDVGVDILVHEMTKANVGQVECRRIWLTRVSLKSFCKYGDP